MNLGNAIIVMMNNHMHKYKIDSSVEGFHNHTIRGYVRNMVGIGALHIHYYEGICTYTDHTHSYKGTTGFPIRTEIGHIHKIENTLSLQDNHIHMITGHTSEEVECNDGKEAHGALI